MYLSIHAAPVFKCFLTTSTYKYSCRGMFHCLHLVGKHGIKRRPFKKCSGSVTFSPGRIQIRCNCSGCGSGFDLFDKKIFTFFANVSSKGRMVVPISSENLSNALKSSVTLCFFFQICPFLVGVVKNLESRSGSGRTEMLDPDPDPN
jgi:hypothetical protein